MTNTTPHLDVARYRQALGSFLTGVTVITTTDAEGNDRGLTANSFTSVSFDPPMVLFCIDKRAGSYDAFIQATGFVVHVLGSEQQDIAKIFASKSAEKFAGMRVRRSSTGAPILESAHASLACNVATVVDAGDHSVVIGNVEAFAVEDHRPLGFYQGRMQSFNTEEELASLAQQSGSRLIVLWVLETVDGQMILRRQDDRHSLPTSEVSTEQLHCEALSGVATGAIGVPVAIDFLYSVYGSPAESMTLVYRGRVNPLGDESAFTRDDLVTVPAHEAAKMLTDQTEHAVLKRYVDERGDATFGIYAGSIARGSVATIDTSTSVRAS